MIKRIILESPSTYKENQMKGRDGNIASDHWTTPEWLYDLLNKEFHFDFDPCPLHADFDGLDAEWGQSNFVNPPYNRIDKPRFIQKAYDEWRKGKTCILLIPAATGTRQFHQLIYPNAEIRFVEGRIAFEGINTKGEMTTKGKGKHDSMVCVFRGDDAKKSSYVRKLIYGKSPTIKKPKKSC